ncbi:MAG: hypothetical protein K2Q12_07650 [Rickettsiales bacterium]|nr:hypothetical protein [Rickettsiales bacterium]
MHMRILIIIAALISVVMGGYYFQWSWQADNYKTLIEKQITKINDGPEGTDVDFKITYEAIHVGGFPFAHEVVFSKPVLVSHFTKEGIGGLFSKQPIQENSSNSRTMDSTFTVNGDVRMGLNYLTSTASIGITGMLNGKDIIDEKSLSWVTKNDSSTSCIADFKSGATLGLIQTFVTGQPWTGEKFLRELDSLNCHSNELQIISANDQTPLMSNSAISFSFSDLLLNEGGTTSVHLVMDAPRVDIYDAYKLFYQRFESINSDDIVYLSPLEKYEVTGSQSFNIDLAITLRDPKNNVAKLDTDHISPPSENPEYVLIDVKDFNFKNKLINVSYPFYMEVEKINEMSKFAFRQKLKMKAEPEFDMAVAESLNDPQAQLELSAASIMTTNGQPDGQLNASIFSEFLPHFSGFGTFVSEIDMDGTFSTKDATNNGGITVRALNILTDHYGLKLEGSYEASKGEGVINVECITCDKLLADVVEYNNRVQRAILVVNPTYHPTLISTEIYESIVAFLNGLNTGKESGTVAFSVVSKGQGNVTIGNKPMMNVMMEAMQTFQPLLAPEPAP